MGYQKKSEIYKIVVPYDFSTFSEAALQKAVSIASVCKAQIELIHIITPVYVGKNDADLLPEVDTFYSKLIKVAQERLQKVALQTTHASSIKVLVKSYLGIVHQVILKHAKTHHADLIIMGTHGVSGFKEFFAGSNAFRVVSEAICPVITIQRKSTKELFKKIMLVILDDTSIKSLSASLIKFAKLNEAKILIAHRNVTDKNNKDNSIKKIISFCELFFNKQGVPFSIINTGENDFIKSVLSNAKKNKVDLIAVSINKKFRLNQFFSGSVIQQLVNHSPIPVLSIP